MPSRLRLALALILFSLPIFTSPLPPVNAQPAVLIGKTWGGPQIDYGHDLALDSQGNIYIAGETYSFGGGSPASSDAIILKFNPAGNLLWQRIWGGSNSSDRAYGISTDTFGNVYVTGMTTSYGYGGSDAFVLKVNASGNLLWQKTWGRASSEIGNDIVVDQTGNAYVAAQTSSVGAGDIAFLKFDPLGNLLWKKTWGGTFFEGSIGIAIDPIADGIYVSGRTMSFGAGSSDVALLKFDSSGAMIWQKTWGSPAFELTTDVAVDPSSRAVYVTGTTDGFGAGNLDLFLLKFDPTSGLLWQRTWGEGGDDYAGGVSVNPISGTIYVTGSPTNAKVLLLQLNPAGALISVWNWGGRFGNFGRRVAVDGLGNVHATGYVCCESAPYPLSSSGNTTLGVPSFNTMLPTYSLAASSIEVNTPPGSLSAQTGSEVYTDGEEVFLFKYGLIPTVRFLTGSSGGSILFEGTTYSNGQSGNFTYRSATATASPPEGHRFVGWSVSGGVSVSNQTQNPTTITITGPGDLTANFAPVPPTIFGLTPIVFYILFGGIVAAAVIATILVFRWYWKKRLASPGPQRL